MAESWKASGRYSGPEFLHLTDIELYVIWGSMIHNNTDIGRALRIRIGDYLHSKGFEVGRDGTHAGTES